MSKSVALVRTKLNLTAGQEKFAQCIVEGMGQCDAYATAYEKTITDKNKKGLIINGGKLMKHPSVLKRIEQLRAPVVKKLGMTLESHLRDLEKMRDAALEAGNFSAAIAAEIARGKHSGVTAADRLDITITHAQWLERLN